MDGDSKRRIHANETFVMDGDSKRRNHANESVVMETANEGSMRMRLS